MNKTRSHYSNGLVSGGGNRHIKGGYIESDDAVVGSARVLQQLSAASTAPIHSDSSHQQLSPELLSLLSISFPFFATWLCTVILLIKIRS